MFPVTTPNKQIDSSTQNKQTPQRRRRDKFAIQQAMSKASGTSGVGMRTKMPHRSAIKADNSEIGLTLRALEEKRWSISSAVAKEKILKAGFPYEGRRAGVIYSWPSIFRLEGIHSDLAVSADRKHQPELFDDLLDTTAAASFLGYRDASSIRKLVADGSLHPFSYVRFGNRGVYRFRPTSLAAHRKPSLHGRIV